MFVCMYVRYTICVCFCMWVVVTSIVSVNSLDFHVVSPKYHLRSLLLSRLLLIKYCHFCHVGYNGIPPLCLTWLEDEDGLARIKESVIRWTGYCTIMVFHNSLRRPPRDLLRVLFFYFCVLFLIHFIRSFVLFIIRSFYFNSFCRSFFRLTRRFLIRKIFLVFFVFPCYLFIYYFCLSPISNAQSS